ncbi:MAG: hypothetical protein HZA13_02440 [Nitrospirae bacterium]|nr:hypothetical protein [Nitrospirota bacterium]
MVQKLKALLFLSLWILAGLLALPSLLRAHEVVGEVTPLMIHMKRVLILIENGKEREAFHETRMVYEDFSHEMGMGMVMQGAGLKTTAGNIDRRFGTQIGMSLEDALKSGDALRLQKVVQELSFLLMREKFETLQATFGKKPVNRESQRTMFWLGRNYFSYLLEPALTKRDPVEGQRLDRLLDSMLYRLEDGQAEIFVDLQKELVKGILKAFRLDLPPLMPGDLHPQ